MLAGRLGVGRSATGLMGEKATSAFRPSRPISMWIPTNQPRIDNADLQLAAQQRAADTNTTYKSPTDMNKGRYTEAQAKEPLHVVVDQADVREKGGLVKTMENSVGKDVLKQMREATIYSCNAGKTWNGKTPVQDLANKYKVPVTGPTAQLKLETDGLSPVKATVGSMESLSSPFIPSPKESSLVTASHGKLSPTPSTHPLHQALTNDK